MKSAVLKGKQEDYIELTRLWEKSVRATHHFLADSEIERLRPLLLEEYLPAVEIYMLRDADGTIKAFTGLSGGKIEMLFVMPEYFGQGLGGRLLRFAVESLGAHSVDVNEQNPGALAFYEKMGFAVVSRDEVDSTGAPYPILHMELAREH